MTPPLAGVCDTHVHVYDSRYPSATTATIFPPDASVDEYRAVQAELGSERVVLVQPSTYGLDNSCQIAAAAEFGDAARLVVVVDDHTPHDELLRLDALGARGARFHMLPGGAVGWEHLTPVAERIAPMGWHIQLQMNGHHLAERAATLAALPTPVVIDHVGRFMPPAGPSSAAVAVLFDLLDTGRFWVKLSAPYESGADDPPSYPAVSAIVAPLVERFPDRLLWATNWPHPGRTDPPAPSAITELTRSWLPTDDLRRRIMVDNPCEVYGFDPVGPPGRPGTDAGDERRG